MVETGECTKLSDVDMAYANYPTRIVIPHHVHIIGWPEECEFTSPQHLKAADLKAVYQAWFDGQARWKEFKGLEYTAFCEEHEKSIQPRGKRSDAGGTHKTQGQKKKKKGGKNSFVVSDDEEDEPEGDDSEDDAPPRKKSKVKESAVLPMDLVGPPGKAKAAWTLAKSGKKGISPAMKRPEQKKKAEREKARKTAEKKVNAAEKKAAAAKKKADKIAGKKGGKQAKASKVSKKAIVDSDDDA